MVTTFDSPADQFQYLYQIWELGNSQPETPVSVSDLAAALDIGEEQSAAMAGVLREFQLLYYRSLGGDIALTRLGLSEVTTARKNPSSSTNFFPSLRSMNLRFSRGHHLFESEVLRKSVYCSIGYNQHAETEHVQPEFQTTGEADSPALLMRDLEELLDDLQTEITNITDKTIKPGIDPTEQYQTPDEPAGSTEQETPESNWPLEDTPARQQARTKAEDSPRRWGYLGRERGSSRRARKVSRAHPDAMRFNRNAPSLLFNNRWRANSGVTKTTEENSRKRLASAKSLELLQQHFGFKAKPEPEVAAHTPVSRHDDTAVELTQNYSAKTALPDQVQRLEQLLDQTIVAGKASAEDAETQQEIYDALEEVNLLLFTFEDTQRAGLRGN